MERFLPALDRTVIVTLFVFAAFSMFSVSVTQIACGLGGLAWILRTHLTGTWKDQRWPLVVPFLLYALACLIAVANAYDISYSYKSLKKLLEILIFFWVLNCVRNTRLRDSLSLILIVSATVAGLFGFYQAWRDSVTIWTRVEGTMSVYMTFAGLLMMVGIHALGRAMFRRPIQPWLWAFIGVITSCLLFTLTLQAAFGFLIGLTFLAFIWKRTPVSILTCVILTTLIACWSPLQSQIQKMKWDDPEYILKQSFSGSLKFRIGQLVTGPETLKMRQALWKSGWEIFKDYPLTGCGFRCVDLINSQYPDPTGHVKHLRGMHNNFIQLAVDTGVLGLTAWLGIWVYFFRLLYHRAKAIKRDLRECWIIYGSAAAGLAFLAGGCFETNFYDSEVAMVLFFIMALPFAGSQSERYNLGKNVSIPNNP